MRTDIWYVWSAGLQEWEPMAKDQIPEVWFLHTKNFGTGKLHICRDNLGRYVATYVA